MKGSINHSLDFTPVHFILLSEAKTKSSLEQQTHNYLIPGAQNINIAVSFLLISSIVQKSHFHPFWFCSLFQNKPKEQSIHLLLESVRAAAVTLKIIHQGKGQGGHANARVRRGNFATLSGGRHMAQSMPTTMTTSMLAILYHTSIPHPSSSKG